VSLDRDALRGILARALVQADSTRAVWEGGSAAFGRADVWSDLDLVAIVRDDAVAATFQIVESALEAAAGIELIWRVPEPTMHGHSQRLYRLERASPFTLVDFVVMKVSAERRFLEPERHGNALVLLDRDGLVAEGRAFDREAHEARMHLAIAQIAAKRAMLDLFVIKEVRRDRGLDALSRFQSMEVAPLVTLLRARYCPDRFDFGMRYLADDLPAQMYAKLMALVFVPSPADVEARSEAARCWIDELLKELG
jgi:predicted nucleotidyltransferase